MLSQLLYQKGIDSIVLERQNRDHVLSRIRAGVLETGFVNLMRQAGVSDRLDAEKFVHDGTVIAFDNEHFRIDFEALTGRHVVVYGQTELTRDLYDAAESRGTKIYFNVENVAIEGADSDNPAVNYELDGQTYRIECDYIAGCDGFHGVSRQTIPKSVRRDFEKTYPFGWLGVLSETPPVHEELIYSNSARGFALCSMRNANLSRYYIQCPITDTLELWDDQMFWDELKQRMPAQFSDTLVTGPSIEKSIAPLRSFVSEPMRWGRLFLCGDAAHIVPPTGAKGLNTAASDIHYLFNGFVQAIQDGDSGGLEQYSANALARVWKTQRFSWWMTNMLHRFPDQSGFDVKLQRAELEFLRENADAQNVMAQNYVGLPY